MHTFGSRRTRSSPAARRWPTWRLTLPGESRWLPRTWNVASTSTSCLLGLVFFSDCLLFKHVFFSRRLAGSWASRTCPRWSTSLPGWSPWAGRGRCTSSRRPTPTSWAASARSRRGSPTRCPHRLSARSAPRPRCCTLTTLQCSRQPVTTPPSRWSGCWPLWTSGGSRPPSTATMRTCTPCSATCCTSRRPPGGCPGRSSGD